METVCVALIKIMKCEEKKYIAFLLQGCDPISIANYF